MGNALKKCKVALKDAKKTIDFMGQ